MIRLETRLEFKPYLGLMYRMTYRNRAVLFLSVFGTLMFLGSLIYMLFVPMPLKEMPLSQLIFGVIILGVMPLSVYRTAKKNYASHAKLREKIVYELSEERFRQIGETFQAEMDWSTVYKVQELKDWILIYQNRQIANLLPKAEMGEQLPEFREMIRRLGIRAKMRRN
ncbi:MAG: YcxB family protein [Marinilabiliales bacterium]|nr:YcxB family protein [Marinilabiliales bacterium]